MNELHQKEMTEKCSDCGGVGLNCNCDEKKQIGTIDLTPTWESACRIYIAVLKNKRGDVYAKLHAEQDIMKLARLYDDHAETMRIAEEESYAAGMLDGQREGNML